MRAESTYDDMSGLVVTSHTETEEIQQALEARTNAFQLKSFTRESLLTKLEIMSVLES